MAFNRDRNSRGGGFKPRFGDRGDRGSNRGPVTMHQAVCDKCRKECEVPFRPTSGKPVYCSSCFEDKKNAGGRGINQFEQLNQKLDKILNILMPIASEVEKKTKAPKKPSAKKK